MATVVAGVAALQALAFLDGGDPAVLDGTLELRLPDWRLRRRSWPPHPDCDCIAGAMTGAARRARRVTLGTMTRVSDRGATGATGAGDDIPQRRVARTAKLASLPLGRRRAGPPSGSAGA